MVRAIITWSLHNRLIVILGTLVLIGAGIYSAYHLNVEAYPDPTPPLVEVITQNPGASPEEMERLVGIPLETALNGMPGLEDLRSTSIAGLNDIKCQFAYGTDYWAARQEVINRIGVRRQPAAGRHARALALEPDRRDRPLRPRRARATRLNQLKAVQDWVLNRALKTVPGVIDVTGYGGTVKQYQVLVDTRLLAAVRRDAAAGRGRDRALERQRRRRHPHAGEPVAQRPRDRAAGRGDRPARPGERRAGRARSRPRSSTTSSKVVVTTVNGNPIYVRQVAKVVVGHRPRLGIVGRAAAARTTSSRASS